MKWFKFSLNVLMYLFAFAGFALSITGSVLIANENAMLDYYIRFEQASNRQLTGWLLCFVPAVIGGCAAIMYLLRNKLPKIGWLGAYIAIAVAVMPLIYMFIYNDYPIFIVLGQIFFICFSATAFVLRLISVRKHSDMSIISEEETIEVN